VFRKEGEYWTIAFAGMLVRLRDAKGMGCLAHLLSHPSERFPAAALLTEAVSRKLNGEQARMTVTKRIKHVVNKIGEHHPSLGHHLMTCVKTGRFCSYMPDPIHPVLWVVSRNLPGDEKRLSGG
jgi:hypothetical protein